jgi:hypothetical protein
MADEPKWQPAEAPPWLQQAKPAEAQWQPADAPPWAKQGKEERGGISEAVRPITTYLPTQREMARESLEQIGHGVEQLKEPTGGDLAKSAKAAIKGVGNVGLGAVGFVASPISAAYRTVLGRPVEETTGIPKEYTEFAAQLATPGIGLTRMPGAKPVPEVPTSTLAERRAGRQIERKASDIGKVKERLETEPTEIVPGSKQTTFEITEDAGLGAAERKARLRNPTPFVERAEERAGARLQALEGQQETGNVADAVEHVRQSRARGQWSIEQDVALADQRAREAAELPGGNYDPATYGNVLRQELRNAEEATRAQETALWRRVDPGGTLRANPQPLQVLEREIYGVMPEGGAAEASLTQAEQTVAGVIQNYRNIIPFQELRDLRHLINTELREELITSGRSPAYARLSRLRQGIADMEEGAFNELGVRDVDASQRLRAASTATRERAEEFGRGPVGDVLRREGSQGPFKVETAQVNDKLLPTGNKGYDVASSYLRAAPDSLEPYTDALTGKMRREVLRPDGAVDPRKLEGFLRRHDGILRAIDERDGGRFSQSLRDIGQAQERLATTLERQRATTEAFEGSELGKLIGAADNDHAINVVGGIFGRADRVDRARQLAQATSASPAAQAGLRRAVQQYVRRTFVGNAEAAGGTQMIPPNAFMNFMKENEAALRQIMLPEQVDAWKAIATEMGRTSRIAQTKTLPGSDTVQNALSVGGSWPWVAADMVISQLATGVPAPLGHAAKPLLKGLLSHIKKNGITSTNKLIDEAMLNPEVARELLKAKGRPSGASVRLEQTAPGLLRTGTLRAATPDDEQQKRAPRQAGGGVPAIGGTGGRPPGARETARAGAARGGAGQALQDGGEAGGQQAAPVAPRERYAAALQGTPTGAGFSGGGQQSKAKALKAVSREDIRKTLQSFGITGEEAGGFAERQLGERSVDSRAYGGGVDDPPGGERAPMHYDPGDDTTFDARFGKWDKTATGKSLPRDDEDVDSSVMMPGDKMIDRYQFQGERGKAGYYQTRGMAEGGEVEDRYAALPSSFNVEDRRDEEPLSAGQMIAGNQAFMGRYPAPYTRGSRRASSGVDDQLHQGLIPPTLLDETKSYLADQLGGVERQHEQEDPLEAAVKHSGAMHSGERGNLPTHGGSDEGKLPLPGQSRGLSRPTDEPLPVMRRNKAGETLPGLVARSWGEGLAGLMTAPKRAYTGELPPDRQVEEFGGPMGMLMTGVARAPAGALGIGRSRRPAPRAPRLAADEIPAADRPVTRSHNLPPEEAPFPQYAEEYPPVGPPTMQLKDKPKFEGETYPEKTYTPEAEAFMKKRGKVMKEMQKGYVPYFDPAERKDVDPSNYPGPNVDTLTIQPKKEETFKEYAKYINQPATAKLLREAYDRGEKLGNAHDWYAMSQLEDAYVKELGEKAGRAAFLDEFAVPMAATTSGNDPRANFLMAHYLEYLRKQGEDIPVGHQFPAPIGGRRVNVNIRDYKAMRERGGYEGLGEDQPKMHNFSRSFIGDLSHGVMDEQMAGGSMAHIKNKAERETWADKARHLGFGMLEKQLHREAARKGLQPGNFQDVAWAGFKGESSGPMIGVINDAVERTHRLTGMPREEIVRRGIIRKEIPIYGLTAAATPYLWGGFQPEEDGSSSPSTGQSPP